LDADWAEGILRFWFEELTPDDWYSKDPAPIDRAVRERFLALHEALTNRLPREVWTEPGAALAAIIAFDQFPRNMFRGTARAFATDAEALTVARHAVERRFDAVVEPERRPFFYMPFEHSEALSDQERCVALFTALGDAELLPYAVEHHAIISRFGRFPHRNRVLERESTEAEHAFLGGHKGFGQ
jgi:uncharacterized protein (DUF924 family)